MEDFETPFTDNGPIRFNSQNYSPSTVSEELQPNQQPLGTKFKSYEQNQAISYYLLNPFQYSITKFDYSIDQNAPKNPNTVSQNDFKNDPGLVYKDVDLEQLLPTFTAEKKSANDVPAQDYHRFMAGNGYFNPRENENNNKDLWYYGSQEIAMHNGFGVAGPGLNVQEVNHIIFPEPQRGGLNSQTLVKYSWENTNYHHNPSWESQNIESINNEQNCKFFNWNGKYNDPTPTPFDKVYTFDSDYCKKIGIEGPLSGSMPYRPVSN
jgi:hypothetical protein